MSVVASLDTGEPLLVERVHGDGVVMQLATACDAEWSDLPLRPVYVPLMQQLVATLASRISPPRNIRTGEPAVALVRATDLAGAGAAAVVAEPGDQVVTYTVVTPDGIRRTLRTQPERSLQIARYTTTQRPGIYTMSLPNGQNLHFVAEASRAESAPALLDPTERDELADQLGATVVDSADAYLEQDQLRRHGREIWQYVLMGFLAFMFLEVVLQQRFARVRV